MLPIQPIDTHERHEDFELIQGQPQRSVWGPVITMLVVLALLIGSLVWLGSEGGAQDPSEPIPNEAPQSPGAP
jgi:hypothetical protein